MWTEFAVSEEVNNNKEGVSNKEKDLVDHTFTPKQLGQKYNRRIENVCRFYGLGKGV